MVDEGFPGVFDFGDELAQFLLRGIDLQVRAAILIGSGLMEQMSDEQYKHAKRNEHGRFCRVNVTCVLIEKVEHWVCKFLIL